MQYKATMGLFLSTLFLAALTTGLVAFSAQASADAANPLPADRYIVLAWNDLGMHCYNPRFRDVGVLPPYNNLYAQVVRVGDPPQIVTAGIAVTYLFTDNTHSVGKTDFWDISPYRGVQNAQWLFKLANPLPADVGLTGMGLSGVMAPSGDHFVAEGVPLTEYRDSAPSVRYPYQTATVIARDAGTGQELARTITVAPVSTEMHCDSCHYDNGPGNENLATGVVDQNILSKHDNENQGDYPPGHQGALMGRRPVLCAECHASNALGAAGAPGVPSLSRAVHRKHRDEVPQDMTGCYLCHPGPQTQCLRDVMSTQFAMTCIDCHGPISQVAQNPDPWRNEPRCDNAACHGSGFAQNDVLYRKSQEHGGIYCEGCHDSTHAIAPSRQPNDGIKFLAWQTHAGPLDTCIVCHATQPTGPGPHGMQPPNTPPLLTGLPDQVVPVNGSANNAIDLWSYASDPQSPNSQLTFTIDNTPDPNAGVSIDGNRYIDIFPAAGWTGQTIVTVRVTDPGGLSATDSFHVTVGEPVPLRKVYLPLILRHK